MKRKFDTKLFEIVLGVFLIIFIVLISAMILYKVFLKESPIEHNGISLSQEDYGKFTEMFDDDKGFIVCNIENKKCNLFYNIEREVKK